MLPRVGEQPEPGLLLVCRRDGLVAPLELRVVRPGTFRVLEGRFAQDMVPRCLKRPEAMEFVICAPGPVRTYRSGKATLLPRDRAQFTFKQQGKTW